MSPLALRRLLRSSRGRLALLITFLALCGAIAAHHGMPMDMHGMPGGAVCLAVLGLGAIVAVAATIIRRARRPWRAPWLLRGWRLAALRIPAPRTIPARAGPLYLRFSVLRR